MCHSRHPRSFFVLLSVIVATCVRICRYDGILRARSGGERALKWSDVTYGEGEKIIDRRAIECFMYIHYIRNNERSPIDRSIGVCLCRRCCALFLCFDGLERHPEPSPRCRLFFVRPLIEQKIELKVIILFGTCIPTININTRIRSVPFLCLCLPIVILVVLEDLLLGHSNIAVHCD